MGKKKCRIRQIFDNHVTVRSKGSTINRFKDFLRKRYFEFFFFLNSSHWPLSGLKGLK